MKIRPLPHPVKEQPALYIVDSSKMQQYMDCPRQFFYRYVMNWDNDTKSHHLIYGEAIHRALEYLLQHDYSLESIDNAYLIASSYYREELPDEMGDTERYPKTTAGIPQLLVDYTKTHSRDHERYEVLYTEVAGSVPISNDRSIHYRIDAIVRDRDSKKIWALEHKTAGQFGRTWVDQWYMKMQVFVYTHVLHCIFDPREVEGIMINGLCIGRATQADMKQERIIKTDFIRVPVCKPVELMEDWLWHINDWYTSIEDDYFGLHTSRETDTVMKCFPRNTENCTKYFGCPFLDYCSAWPNPLQKDMPYGFVERVWNPADREKDASIILNLSKKKE